MPGQHGNIDQNTDPLGDGCGRRTQGKAVQIMKSNALTRRNARKRALIDDPAPIQKSPAVQPRSHLWQGHAYRHSGFCLSLLRGNHAPSVGRHGPTTPIARRI